MVLKILNKSTVIHSTVILHIQCWFCLLFI